MRYTGVEAEPEEQVRPLEKPSPATDSKPYTYADLAAKIQSVLDRD